MQSFERTSKIGSALTASEWPPLQLAAWRDTRETLHRYVQIVGKIQLETTRRLNHFWNVPLALTSCGLSTSAMPYEDRSFEIELNLLNHVVHIRTSDGDERNMPLLPRAVADFYAELMSTLAALGIHVAIWDHPVELVREAIPFPRDRIHSAYDPQWASRFLRVLGHVGDGLNEFRSRFIGKASPVGFYWGTFDLAAARYSGRRAPNPPTTPIEREAFSHEVSEVGFWPGDDRYGEPAFFALHAPPPDGYSTALVRPKAAFWHAEMGCFLLPYETVRNSPSPRATMLDFFESTYGAGARLAEWSQELDRGA